MPRRPYRTLDDLDIEELGVFEYLDEDTARFLPAPPTPVKAPVRNYLLESRLRLELPMLWSWIFFSCFLVSATTGFFAIVTFLRVTRAPRRRR